MKNILWFSFLIIVACQSNNEIIITATDNGDNLINKPLVSIVTVQKKKFKHYFNTQGSVISKEMAFLRPELSGVVHTLNIEEGDYVKKGQLIITVSTDVLVAQLAEINEQVFFMEYLFEKQKNLFNEGLSTEIQLKEVENNFNRIKKSKNTLLTQLEKAKVVAPFSGFIEKVMVQIGESVSPMVSVCHLVSTDDLYVVADVSETLLSKISKNNPLEVYFPSLNLKLEALKINRIGKIVNPINRTVKIETRLPSSKKLIPNLMAELKINHYSKDSAICLPSRLILKDSDGNTYVKLLDNKNKVLICPIILGNSEKSEVEIISGLKEGAKIIDNGKSTVLEGQEVEIISGVNS
jgi:RND family efflux transporter MFP subunit